MNGMFLNSDAYLRGTSQHSFSDNGSELFTNFICKIEGWKTRTKNLHWAAPVENGDSIHRRLDDLLDTLVEYEDAIAEGYMGILGKMNPDDINAIGCACTKAADLVSIILTDTVSFYDSLPADTRYKGITSETEVFIQSLNKYKYLFSLCNSI